VHSVVNALFKPQSTQRCTEEAADRAIISAKQKPPVFSDGLKSASF